MRSVDVNLTSNLDLKGRKAARSLTGENNESVRSQLGMRIRRESVKHNHPVNVNMPEP